MWKTADFSHTLALFCTFFTTFAQRTPQKNRRQHYIMKTKLYLDTRGVDETKEAPVKIAINVFGSSVYLSTGVKVLQSQWDRQTGQVRAHPLKARLNLALSEKKLKVDRALDELREEGKLHGVTPSEIKRLVTDRLNPATEKKRQENGLFLPAFRKWSASRKAEGTRVSYGQTEKKILAFDRKAESLRFEDLTRDWLTRFEAWMEKNGSRSVNTRNIHLRNIRAALNDAIDDGRTVHYPFRKFKIIPEPTKDRSLSVEKLRELREAKCEPWQEEARDMFFLSFFLCGINLGDLAGIGGAAEGVIDVSRMKTGQPLRITVIPEAQAIIDKYSGKSHLVNILERYRDYRSYAHRVNDALKRIGSEYNPHTKQWEGTPVCGDLSLIWARFSWATLAGELDIPDKTVGSALGHSTRKSVTNIYMRNDMKKKVAEAQRKVAAYVLDAE